MIAVITIMYNYIYIHPDKVEHTHAIGCLVHLNFYTSIKNTRWTLGEYIEKCKDQTTCFLKIQNFATLSFLLICSFSLHLNLHFWNFLIKRLSDWFGFFPFFGEFPGYKSVVCVCVCQLNKVNLHTRLDQHPSCLEMQNRTSLHGKSQATHKSVTRDNESDDECDDEALMTDVNQVWAD